MFKVGDFVELTESAKARLREGGSFNDFDDLLEVTTHEESGSLCVYCKNHIYWIPAHYDGWLKPAADFEVEYV